MDNHESSPTTTDTPVADDDAWFAKQMATAPRLWLWRDEPLAAMERLIIDLLDVWDPEWQPGKSLHERAVALVGPVTKSEEVGKRSK